MREIIFRGKPLNKEEWVYGFLFHDENRYCIIDKRYHDNLFNLIEVDPQTIGQYTGINDSEKNKIFEGDILVIKTAINENNIYGMVSYDEDYGGFVIKDMYKTVRLNCDTAFYSKKINK